MQVHAFFAINVIFITVTLSLPSATPVTLHPCLFTPAKQTQLHEARREAEEARLEGTSKSTYISPELARGDAEHGDRLVEENRRLAQELSVLRAQMEEMLLSVSRGKLANAPGSPADGQRPALLHDLGGHEGNGDTNVNGGVALAKVEANLSADSVNEPEKAERYRLTAAPPSSKAGAASGPSPHKEIRSGKAPCCGSADEGSAADAGGTGDRKLTLVAPCPSKDVPERGAFASSSSNSGSGCESETRRLVEAEAARVLAELRANPPAATRALLLARGELDAHVAVATSRLAASGLLRSPLSPLLDHGLGAEASLRESSSVATRHVRCSQG